MLTFTSASGTFSVALADVVEVCPRSRLRPMPDPGPGVVGVMIRDGEAFTIRGSATDPGDLVLLVRIGGEATGLVVASVSLDAGGAARSSARQFSLDALTREG